MFVVETQALERIMAHTLCTRQVSTTGDVILEVQSLATDYIVSDVERPQDAMAFVAAIVH